ncbi:MAG: sulfotransferase [Chloroflexi bacterium]|nr:sulfotransferase [Chloroflexota bacterium]
MSQPSHIFIVGLARTGTTLTRTILDSSDRIGLGGEAMFFGDKRWLGLKPREGYRHKFAHVGDLKTDAGVRRIVDYIYSIRQDNYWSKIAKKVDRAEFMLKLLATDRSERALLDLAMSFYAGNKPIRGEKTPANLYAVRQLLEWFPQARIIHAFRDPRAVYISNKRKYEHRALPRTSTLARKTKLLFEFYATLDVALAWRHAIQLHREYQRDYPGQYTLSKFEDLVTQPEGTLQKLCKFLDIPFQQCMLDQLVVNSSFLPKRQQAGFDKAAVDRWRQYLHPMLNRWFIFWCKRQLVEFGYVL